MNLAAFTLLCVLCLAFGSSLVDSKRKERKCKIVPASTTNCTISAGTSCKNITALTEFVNAGQSHALVCPKNASTPVLMEIMIIFRIPRVKCNTYVGVTSICFIPDVSAADESCQQLAADEAVTRISCTDQPTLRTRLVTPDLRLCLLNVTVTPNVFDDIQVRISPKLPDREGDNSEEYTD